MAAGGGVTLRHMENVRDTRPWFWILIAIVFAVAVAGLVIAISANNSSVDEKKIVNEATAEIKEEVAGLNGAIKAADELQEESDKRAAEDRRRIKREVGAAVSGGEEQLNKLKARTKSLEAEMAESKSRDANLRKSVENLEAGEEDLEAEVAELDEELAKLKKQARRAAGGRPAPERVSCRSAGAGWRPRRQRCRACRGCGRQRC
jgi:DNA repair exonuclease SbcCD ATPase subunit